MQPVILSDACSHLCSAFESICHPASERSSFDSPRSPVQWKSFLGMQPTLTQVPPIPHLVPWGEGFTKSASPTFAPLATAAEAAAKPPDPPPTTNRSQLNSWSIKKYYEGKIQNVQINQFSQEKLIDLFPTKVQKKHLILLMSSTPSLYASQRGPSKLQPCLKKHTKTYQLLLNRPAIQQQSLTANLNADNIFKHHLPSFIGEDANQRPIGGMNLLKKLSVHKDARGRKGSKFKFRNQDSRDPNLILTKGRRVLTEIKEPKSAVKPEKLYRSIDPSDQTLKQHKIYQAKSRNLQKTLTQRHSKLTQWSTTERQTKQTKNYLDRSAILNQISFEKHLIEHTGDQYFELNLRDRWKEEVKMSKYVYQLNKEEPFSNHKSIILLKKHHPHLKERKKLLLQGRGLQNNSLQAY